MLPSGPGWDDVGCWASLRKAFGSGRDRCAGAGVLEHPAHPEPVAGAQRDGTDRYRAPGCSSTRHLLVMDQKVTDLGTVQKSVILHLRNESSRIKITDSRPGQNSAIFLFIRGQAVFA